MGFQTIANRCISFGEFAMLRRYLCRQHVIIVLVVSCFVIIMMILYWVAQYQYGDNPQLLENLRLFY